MSLVYACPYLLGVAGDGVVAAYFKLAGKMIDETEVNGGTDVNGDGAMGNIMWGVMLIRKNVAATDEFNDPAISTK